MLVNILQIAQGVIVWAQPYVGAVEDVDVEWLPAGDQDPLADIEFLILDQKWCFHVFLDDFRGSLFALMDYIFEFVGAINTNPTSIVRWLNDPDIPHAINFSILRQIFGQLGVQSTNLNFVKQTNPILK